MSQTARIHTIVARARRRLRLQAALERATTASILALAIAIVAVYLYRSRILGGAATAALLIAAGVVIIAGAVIGGIRRYSAAAVAARVDRANGLADRLGTACDFEAQLAAGGVDDAQTRSLMEAAIADALAHVPRADVRAAAPYRRPQDSWPALAFLCVTLVIAALYFPTPDDASPGALAIGRDGTSIADRLSDEPLALDDDDILYTRDLLDELRETAERTGDEHLEAFVRDVDELLEQAQRGEISKEELLKELARREQEYMEGSDQDLEVSIDDLRKTGKELEQNPLTRELGKALEQGDLRKAQQELDALSEKLANETLSEREREKLAKTLDEAAEQFEKREQKREQAAAREIEQKREELRRLQKKLEQEKDPDERAEEKRRLEKKERELKQLERKEQQRQEEAQKRHLKRLHRNMREASKDLRKEGEQGQRQASRRMKDLQRDTGQVENEARKIRNQRKVATQMGDLKEALRRAKQRGRGMRDQFGKNQRNRDFGRRAAGGRGDREALRPGPGQKPGQGQPGQGQPGQDPGGSQWGDQDGGDPLGAPTPRMDNTRDESVSAAEHGREGESTRETILSAAQKGFASRSYQKVYTAYESVIEEVMRAEKVPSGYKYYIKRYFQKIKPHSMD